MKSILLHTTLAAAVALTLPVSAFAKKKAAAAPDASASPAASATPTASASPSASPAASPASPDANRKLPFRGTLSSVDKNAKTFSIKGKEKTRVFTVTAQTQLFKADGATAATWDDLVVGQIVRGSAKKTGDEAFEALRVKIGAKPEPSPAASASPSPKK